MPLPEHHIRRARQCRRCTPNCLPGRRQPRHSTPSVEEGTTALTAEISPLKQIHSSYNSVSLSLSFFCTVSINVQGCVGGRLKQKLSTTEPIPEFSITTLVPRFQQSKKKKKSNNKQISRITLIHLHESQCFGDPRTDKSSKKFAPRSSSDILDTPRGRQSSPVSRDTPVVHAE